MMIQVPTPASAAEIPAEDFTGSAAAGLVPDFWQHLAAATAASATPAADPDLAAALDDLATSGDEVVARITLPRVGLPRSGGAAALRSVAVERISRRQERL